MGWVPNDGLREWYQRSYKVTHKLWYPFCRTSTAWGYRSLGWIIWILMNLWLQLKRESNKWPCIWRKTKRRVEPLPVRRTSAWPGPCTVRERITHRSRLHCTALPWRSPLKLRESALNKHSQQVYQDMETPIIVINCASQESSKILQEGR